MKNISYTIAILLVTIISFGQKDNNDVYKMSQNHISNVNITGCISQHNYEKDVELRVKSKKIINDEIEVVFEYVDKPKGCYGGDSKSYYNNYYTSVGKTDYYKGYYGTKPADSYYVAPSTYNTPTYYYSSNYSTPVYTSPHTSN